MKLRYSILCLTISSLSLMMMACESGPAASEQLITILEGQVMGTYYRLSYFDPEQRDFRQSVDSLLQAINDEVSTYIESSLISRFNRSAAGIRLDQPRRAEHFIANIELAGKVYEASDGAFDPTVMPLVNYWGFGYTPKKPVSYVDSAVVDSLLQFVGFEKIELVERGDSLFLRKSNPGVQLDFSACAKGYGVDMLGRFLEAKGISGYLADIGGEVYAKGRKANGEAWRIGINMPSEDASLTEIQTAILLTDRAVATSGNYRNFYEVAGQKYSHTINPKTGYPERSNLLSASVFAADCGTADAFATACMVKGLDGAYEMVSGRLELDGYFIFGGADGKMQTKYTKGVTDLLESQ